MPEPIRLALVITELEPGGAERCLTNLATRINREKFEPVVYSLGPRPAQAKGLLVDVLETARIPVQFLGLTHWSQYFRGVRRLAARLAEQRAEILQSFLFHANVLAARAAIQAKVPHVCSGIRVADPRQTRSGLERWATGKAERLVCVSQSVAEFCRQRGFAAEKLVVIPNGIDVDRWRSAVAADLTQFGVPRGRRAVVYVGRLDKQKGLAEFFVVLKPFFQAAANHDLLLVGEGPEKDRLQRLVHEAGVADRVHFAGWRPDVREIVMACDLVVLPSRWEGMPNAVLEAMAAGKPVVATRSEGVSELLGDDEDLQIVPISDQSQMAEKMSEIVSKPKLASDLGLHNRARAERLFSLDATVIQYERLFESLARG